MHRLIVLNTISYSDFILSAPLKIVLTNYWMRQCDNDDDRIELARQTNNDTFVETFTTTELRSCSDNTTVKTLAEGCATVSEQTINMLLIIGRREARQCNFMLSDVTFSEVVRCQSMQRIRRTFAIKNVDYGDEITCKHA